MTSAPAEPSPAAGVPVSVDVIPPGEGSVGETHRLPALTRSVRRLLAALAFLFAASVAARFHGSSLACWNADLSDVRIGDTSTGLKLSTPKKLRHDEWGVWTPAMLSQARQQPPFPIHNASLGAGATPLLMSLPARHYTMFFRPQLWGFFVLPFEFAFSWYWNVKVFALFTAMFLLCWVLTGGRLGWSVFGAVAIQFSYFVQWWFSTPAMLPEMLACWGLGLVAAIGLFLPGYGWRGHALAMGVLVVCGVNFFLCCYPAFEIPLLHVGLCVLAGTVWQQGLFSWRGGLRLAGALAVTAIALVPWLLDCLPVLRIEAATVYPGQRHVYGGDMKFYRYLSGLLNPVLSERVCPPKLFNACEAANFFPLWLLPFALGVVSLGRFAFAREGSWREWLRARGLKVMLCAYLTAVTVYMFVKLPHWLGTLTLIDRSYGRRCLLGMGVAGVLLLVLSLTTRTRTPVGAWTDRRPSKPTAWIAGLAWSLGVLGFLAWARMAFPESLGLRNTGALAAMGVFLGVAYLSGPRWLLPVGWAAIFVTQTALINPLAVGLPELLDSPMLDRMTAIVRADPAAQWAFYDSGVGAELLKSTGANVVNGLRIVPDSDLIRQLDPDGRDTAKYSRYCNLCFNTAPYARGVTVKLHAKVFCFVGIHPGRLRERFPALRYLAVPHAMPDAVAAGFQVLGHSEVNHLWLYGLPPDAPVAPAVPSPR